jgi:hypothetical protein
MKTLWTLLCLLLACGGSDSTTGREVLLHTQLRADPAVAGEFLSETGWTIKLSKALVSVGSLYYFDGEPAFVTREPPSLWKRFARLATPSIAHAHPGHYLAGDALGQMITPALGDLLAAGNPLPDGNGVTGLYRSARFKFSAPGAALGELAGQVARVQGVAKKADQVIYFELSASYEDVARSVSMGEVDGCVFDEQDVAEDGTVTVTVKPQIWFNLVDFSGVAPGTAAAPTRVPAGDTPQLAFALGVVQLSAYHFSYAL